jgi:hypothetical protein
MLESRTRHDRPEVVEHGTPLVQHHYRPKLTIFALAAVVIAGVGGSPPAAATAQSSTPVAIAGEDPNAPCATSRLRIGDLESVDATIGGGIQRATEEAQRWQADARLYTLRLGCPLLTTGVQWEGVFFSETAQSFYSTDTGRTDAVNDAPETIPTLDPAGIQMREVYRSLIRAGFSDDLRLTAQGGVTIRQSTDSHPFGPSAAPRNQTYAHLAIEVDGQITDVWVSTSDYTIYRYTT